jgi:indolepyruvate ferredoxin oxidoreductase beta subunit
MAKDLNVSSDAKTVLLCGVGGQGTILASDLLARTICASGYDAKMSEIHGMAQRGGAVTTIVRFGKDPVHSMVCDEGCADYLLSFETTEALRNISFLKKGGVLLVNDASIKPQSVLTGKGRMPEHARERLQAYGAKLVPASELAFQAGSPKSANVVLLGALAASLPFERGLWDEIIAHHVPPKTVEGNLKAFQLGIDAVAE